MDVSDKICFDWPSGFREKIFEIVDGWTTDHGHPISSPCELNGSDELIMTIWCIIKSQKLTETLP